MEVKPAQSITDFARGQKDCRLGFAAPSNESADYIRGYGHQYSIEQCLSERKGWKAS